MAKTPVVHKLVDDFKTFALRDGGYPMREGMHLYWDLLNLPAMKQIFKDNWEFQTKYPQYLPIVNKWILAGMDISKLSPADQNIMKEVLNTPEAKNKIAMMKEIVASP